MRIVGGRHKGRRLEAPAGRDVRPTIDRVREALFNVLVHSDWGPDGADPVTDAVVLDAFCGTGALGLEALSRGAAEAWFMDRSPQSLAVAQRNIATLGEEAHAHTLRCDVLHPPAPGCTTAGLVFLDPPYGGDIAGPALMALAYRGWLARGCVCVVELDRRDAFAPPAGFEPLDRRDYGDSRLVFLHVPCRGQLQEV